MNIISGKAKCKEHCYGRKLDDIEVKNGIQDVLDNLMYILPKDFQINVDRSEYETIIKVIYKAKVSK